MVSIIIVNFNTFDLLIDCVKSIYDNFKEGTFEVIVVDNNSSSFNIELFKSYFPFVNLILNDVNKGFGAANNIGAKHANGNYLLFLNPDMIVYEDVLSSYLEAYNVLESEGQKVGCLGIKLVDSNFEACHSSGVFCSFLKKTGNYKFSYSGLERVDVIIGANMFISKKLFVLFNGFDENIFLYEEEMEFQYRLFKQGFFSYLLDKQGIIHLEGKSSNSYTKRAYSFISQQYMSNIHSGVRQRFTLYVKNVLLSVYNLRNPGISICDKFKLIIICILRLQRKI